MRRQILPLSGVLLLQLILPLASVSPFSIPERREKPTIHGKRDSKPTPWFPQNEDLNTCLSHRSMLRSFWKSGGSNKETGYVLPYNEETDTTCSRSAREYWVKARANGNGKSEARPAGNLSYVLDHYNVTNGVIYVAPGVYNASIERFPLTITSNNVNILATGNVSETNINGTNPDDSENGSGAGFNVQGKNVTIAGFTITNNWEGVLTWNGGISLLGNIFTENKWGVDLSGNTTQLRETFSQKTIGTGSLLGVLETGAIIWFKETRSLIQDLGMVLRYMIGNITTPSRKITSGTIIGV